MASQRVDRSSSYKHSLVCLTLTLLWVSANADFYSDRFESLGRRDHPWSRDIQMDLASSDYSPIYSRFSDLKKRHSMFESSESFDSPREFFSATKKIPREDKHFKKMISPFYTIKEKDSQKYKDVVMKSGVPYCQEVKTKRTDREVNAKDSMICYKCKNPKNGATYEQCSFVSQPLAESTSTQEVVKPPGYRSRRSNSDEGSSFKGFDDYRKRDSPYRFSDKLFSDASEGVPSEYKKKDEKCEKVVKDSMVCMVCKDTKSNGKYEQCSYVRQPNEKRYMYSKSSSFKNPQRREDKEEDEEPKESDRKYSETKPVKEEHFSSERYHDKEEPEKESQKESKESSNGCKRVEKDSKICTVCKDPETGGNYEKCSYTYQPDDKIYKYSKSKSFGSPRESSKEEPSYEDSSRKDSEEYKRDYTIPESYYAKEKPSRSSSYFEDEEPKSSYQQAPSKTHEELSDYERSKSESEKVAESIEASNCKEVQKDSMVCKVCKDPKTGSNSEQCSYKYQPKEKKYSYSKSRSFGSPTETEGESSNASENKEHSEPSYKGRSYDSSEERKPYFTDSDTKREFRESKDSEEKEEEKEEPTTKPPKTKIDAGFYDAFKKKAEIQKVLQEFQKEDRSNCKKLIRDHMTCYQCVDEKGFQKEECAFVGPDEDKSEYKEKEEPSKKVPRSTNIEDYHVDYLPLEPDVSASETVQVKRRQPVAESSEEKAESKEAEPYEYVAETRPVFDKILGFTLPAYMLSTSEHEEEFDKIVSSKV